MYVSHIFIFLYFFCVFFFFFFNDTATTEIYTLSLHDALPIFYVDVGLAHDKAYLSLGNKFEELATHKEKPLAKQGEEISKEHLNELIYSYLEDFTLKLHGEHGKALIETHKNRKAKDADEKEKHLDELAEKVGLLNKQNPQESTYLAMKQILKENKYRSHRAILRLAPKIVEQAHGHMTSLYFKETLGHEKYRDKPKWALEALNKLSKTNYEMDVDEEKRSKFHGYDTHKLAPDLIALAHKGAELENDKIKEYGLKVKGKEYKNPLKKAA